MSIYSWSIGHILEHEFFCLGWAGSKEKKVDLSFSGQLLRVVFFQLFKGKKNRFFFWKHCRKFPHFLVILMILFTAESLRFFIYISVCCWTFELSLLLNLWDYLLLLNLWIFFTAEPLRLCSGLCICLLHCKCLQGFTGKVHFVLVKMIGKHYTEGNHNKITGKIFNCYG